MDFSYQYTVEQQDFRQTVSGWLNKNVPEDADALYDREEGVAVLVQLSRELGNMGWLAPSESAESGGAALSADLTVVVLEELNRRGLLLLVQGEAQALRAALNIWDNGRAVGTSDSLQSLCQRGSRVYGGMTSLLSPRSDGSDLSWITNSVGLSGHAGCGRVHSQRGRVCSGGWATTPDILWTVALVESNDSEPLPVCLLVDGASEGITLARSRTLSPMAARSVRFDDVWVLRTDALGPEGDGHRVISAQVSLDLNADLPRWVETETDALLDYARETKLEGKPLGADPIRARILVEAYIASRVSRLLRMRANWERSQDGEIKRAEAMASLWRRGAASELSDVARQVVGPRALLSSDDPQSAGTGRFERLSRRELGEREEGDAESEALAAEIGMGDSSGETVVR